MAKRRIHRVGTLALCLWLAVACEQQKKEAPTGNPSATLSSAPRAATPEKTTEPSPEGCKAKGDKPMQLGSVLGDAYGFAADAMHVYVSTWQVYGGRGEITKIRKDGQGSQPLAGLKLEPRGLAVDGDTLYFTTGIRLNSVAKNGGSTTSLNDQFSSQNIVVTEKAVYGVAGNYGPYDRLARISKKGGDVTEIASAKRPKVSTGQNGYNGLALDESGLYVADAGNGRILKFPFEPGKPQPLATGLKRPYELAIDSANVYFTLGNGDLLMVGKSGGKTSKLASGLTENSRIAVESGVVYTTQSKGDLADIVKVVAADTSVKAVFEVPATHLVSAIAMDKECVYWVERQDASKSVIMSLAR